MAAAAARCGPAARAEPAAGWEVRVPDRIEIALGEAGVLAVAIVLERGLSVSRDAPVIIDLRARRVAAPPGAAPGLTLKRPRLGRSDAVDPAADAPQFAVPLRPAAAGEYAVAVHARMWVCGARTCRPAEARREVRVVVAAPGPAGGGAAR
jgi:hypothetical protein